MPTRIIRDGIITSARINALSDGAELFYRRLMSVVDDFGRYYGHPVTLRTAAWPTCPDKHADEEVLEWLVELTTGDAPLLLAYSVGDAQYIQIEAFGQRLRSPKSRFPSPPENNGGGSRTNGGESAAERGETAAERGQLTARARGGERREARGERRRFNSTVEKCGNVENPSASPPVATQKPKPPTRAVSSVPAALPEEDVAYVRASMNALAREVKLPEPDDGIVRQVCLACRGATGPEIHETLRGLFFQRRFASIRSWGLVPVVLADCFRQRVS